MVEGPQVVWLAPDSKVLDGRHAWLACLVKHFNPMFKTWTGNKEKFVRKRNTTRRHLTQEERRAKAKEKARQLIQEAASRQRRGTCGSNEPKVITRGKPTQQKERKPISTKLPLQKVLDGIKDFPEAELEGYRELIRRTYPTPLSSGSR